jgi:hypothetical protein
MKHNHKIMDELCDYLGEDLDSPMCQELKSHVDNCEICQEYLRSVKGTVYILKKLQADQKVPEVIVQKIIQKVEKKENGQNSNS